MLYQVAGGGGTRLGTVSLSHCSVLISHIMSILPLLAATCLGSCSRASLSCSCLNDRNTLCFYFRLGYCIIGCFSSTLIEYDKCWRSISNLHHGVYIERRKCMSRLLNKKDNMHIRSKTANFHHSIYQRYRPWTKYPPCQQMSLSAPPFWCFPWSRALDMDCASGQIDTKAKTTRSAS